MDIERVLESARRMANALTPTHKPWVAGDCKWVVRFPTGRRYFKTEQLGLDAISAFMAGRPGKLKPAQEEEYRMCCDLLAGQNVRVLDAVRFYVEHAPKAEALTLEQAVERHLARKRPKVGDVHYTALEKSLTYLIDDLGGETKIGPLIYVGAAKFLNDQAEGTRPQRYSHVAALLRGVEEQAPGAVKKLAEAVELPESDEAPDPHFLSVMDAAILLHHVRQEHPCWLGAVALKLFTGIRSFEIGRLLWRDVDLEQRIVRIGSDVAKRTRGKKNRRVIDWWPDCLTDWMMLCQRPPKAMVAPIPSRGKFNPESLAAQRRFVAWTSHTLKSELAQLGVDLRKNDLRHTYATYGVAYHQSADQIALQLGHGDSRMLFAHYRNWTSKTEAQSFFTLSPQNAERLHAERVAPIAIQHHG